MMKIESVSLCRKHPDYVRRTSSYHSFGMIVTEEKIVIRLGVWFLHTTSTLSISDFSVSVLAYYVVVLVPLHTLHTFACIYMHLNVFTLHSYFLFLHTFA
jgi:hypothetical protein